MAFYVKRSLESGRIRFSVDPLRARVAQPAGLSTGTKGEFLRKSVPDLYFAEEKRIRTPTAMTTVSGAPPPPSGRYKWTIGELAVMGIGVLLILLGITVVALKGAQGWIQIILGVGLLITPPIRTAKKRREARILYEAERVAREEQEKKDRAILEELNARIQRLHQKVDASTLGDLERHRLESGIPYEILSPAGRRALATLAFERIGASGFSPDGLARELKGVAAATGLNPEDFQMARREIVQKVIWHLLADGTLDPTALQEVRTLQQALEVTDDELVAEKRAIVALAEVQNPPQPKALPGLPRGEVALYRTRGVHHSLAKSPKWKVLGSNAATEQSCDLTVTPTGVIFGREGITHGEIADVEADADDRSVTVTRRDGETPYRFVVDNPVELGLAIASAMVAVPQR